MSATPELCGCGRPLHYGDPLLEKMVANFVAVLGPTAAVRVGGRTYHVPRHYIALHGLKATELPALSARYGWAVS